MLNPNESLLLCYTGPVRQTWYLSSGSSMQYVCNIPPFSLSSHISSLPPPTADGLVQSAVTARQRLKNLLEKSTPLSNFPLSSIRGAQHNQVLFRHVKIRLTKQAKKQLKHAALERAASLPRTAINNLGRAFVAQPIQSQPAACVAGEGSPSKPQTSSSG